jgi:DNA-directed RNA polymerase specialized sigma24 family protein
MGGARGAYSHVSTATAQRSRSRDRLTDDLTFDALTREQFEVELGRHLPLLFRRELRYTRQQDTADDLVQDTLERAHRRLALFQPGTDLRAWLLTIIRNVWIMGHRRRLAACPNVSMEALDETTLHHFSAEHIVGGSIVERLVIDHLGEAAILNAMHALPQSHREVVLLIDNPVCYKQQSRLLTSCHSSADEPVRDSSRTRRASRRTRPRSQLNGRIVTRRTRDLLLGSTEEGSARSGVSARDWT